ncbi:MAG: hypothetical protein ACLFVA_03435 [Dehalococcoidia bacterium]
MEFDRAGAEMLTAPQRDCHGLRPRNDEGNRGGGIRETRDCRAYPFAMRGASAHHNEEILAEGNQTRDIRC